jgi:8-oxo-dGTP pyrophosphatase MutT (NUDIX family)
MSPLVDLDSVQSISQIVDYDISQISKLPDNYIPVATETILSLEPGSGKIMLLVSERLGEEGGLQVTGGKRNSQDPTIVNTSDRETKEETGIKIKDKISLTYLVDDLIIDNESAVSPRISFLGKPEPFYPVPEAEKGKFTKWEWHPLLDFLWAIEEDAPGIYESLRKHFKSPIYRKALYDYIKEMVDRNMIPPQDKVLKMLITEG